VFPALARVDVGRCLVLELEAALFQSVHDLSPNPVGYENVVGKVGRDEEDGAGKN